MDEKPAWLQRRDNDAEKVLNYMVGRRRAGRMGTWSMGGLLDELRNAGISIKNRERLSTALSHLYDGGVLHIEGDRLDNTGFGPLPELAQGDIRDRGLTQAPVNDQRAN